MFDLHVPSIGSIESSMANFFDRPKVLHAVDSARRKVLSKFGAFVRTRDRSSQRKRKGISKPGAPPSSHLGLVRQFTFFAYDPEAKSVVIGPAKLNQRNSDTLVSLEKGGTVERMFKGHRVQAHYQSRPHTKPAFDIELKKMPMAFQDQVKG
jgi:hypothetical protein